MPSNIWFAFKGLTKESFILNTANILHDPLRELKNLLLSLNINFNMQTLILAGGLGTRLSEHTKFIPKPMVRIGNKPIISHIIDIYMQNGFNDFYIAAGFKSKIIKKFFLLKHNPKISNTHLSLLLNKEIEIIFKNFKLTIIETGLKSLTGDR